MIEELTRKTYKSLYFLILGDNLYEKVYEIFSNTLYIYIYIHTYIYIYIYMYVYISRN